jgi:hypothetical protein
MTAIMTSGRRAGKTSLRKAMQKADKLLGLSAKLLAADDQPVFRQSQIHLNVQLALHLMKVKS